MALGTKDPVNDRQWHHFYGVESEDEELSIPKSMAASFSQEDDPDKEKTTNMSPSYVFAKYVSQSLSAMDDRARFIAINNIQNTIFRAQIRCLPVMK